jgi:hypothetical protein
MHRVSKGPDGNYRWWEEFDLIPPTHTDVREATRAESGVIDAILILDRTDRPNPSEPLIQLIHELMLANGETFLKITKPRPVEQLVTIQVVRTTQITRREAFVVTMRESDLDGNGQRPGGGVIAAIEGIPNEGTSVTSGTSVQVTEPNPVYEMEVYRGAVKEVTS